MTITLTTRPSRGQSYVDWRGIWENALNARVDFNAGALAGRQEWHDIGQLPGDWARTFTTRTNVGAIVFVVCSYRTPIAWFDAEAGHWVMPEVKYSNTTSKHQSLVRSALGDREVLS